MPNSNLIIKLSPWVFVFLWSTGFVGAKYSLPYAEPFTLLSLRMLLTVLVFLGLMVIFKAKRLSLRQSLHQMVVGLFVHVGYLGSVFAAIKFGMPAGVSAIIVGLQPIITATIALYWFKESLAMKQWLGLLAGFAGVSVVLLAGQHKGDFEVALTPLLFCFVAVFSISIGTLYQKRFGQGADLISGSFYQYLVSTVALFGLAVSFETGEIEWSSTFILAMLWLIFGLSVTAVLLLMYLIRQGEAAKVASYFYMVPVFAAIMTWLLFDERLSIIAIGGVFMTVMGIYMVQTSSIAPSRPKI